MEPRTITLPVTFQVGSRPTLGPPTGGSHQVWATLEVPDDRRSYTLMIGDVDDTRMAARAIHDDERARDGDRRLYAQADLAEFVEALFGKLAELLERPVFACCDSPQPDLAGTCQACQTALDADQLRALVDCEHPTVADEPAGERSPCPDCGLVWCQALAAINVQHYDVGEMSFASFDEGDARPCERPATGARKDGRTFCTAHQAGGDVLIVERSSGW